jgi:hypothetical protein
MTNHPPTEPHTETHTALLLSSDLFGGDFHTLSSGSISYYNSSYIVRRYHPNRPWQYDLYRASSNQQLGTLPMVHFGISDGSGSHHFYLSCGRRTFTVVTPSSTSPGITNHVQYHVQSIYFVTTERFFVGSDSGTSDTTCRGTNLASGP